VKDVKDGKEAKKKKRETSRDGRSPVSRPQTPRAVHIRFKRTKILDDWSSSMTFLNPDLIDLPSTDAEGRSH